nr:MFS transporter [Sphingobium boeckii]
MGWGVGSLSVAILYNTTGLLLLRFMVDNLALSAGLAALLIAGSKIYDGLIDPLVGMVSDRFETRMGRRRPWLLAGGVICALSLPLLFAPPTLSDSATIVWMAGALIVYSTGYAVFCVPYMAMPAEMTEDSHQRSVIMSWRVKAIAIGQLLAGAAGPALIVAFGGGRDGHAGMSMVMGILVLLAALVCFRMTRNARRLPRSTHRPGWRDQLGILRNSDFVWLLVAKLLQLTGVATSSAVIAFFMQRILKLSDAHLGFVFGASTIGIIVGAPIWTRISKHLGKHKTYLLAAAVHSLAGITWMFAQPGESLSILVLRSAILGVGSAGMLLIGQSLLPDVAAADAAKSGFAREGAFAGLYTTIEKVSYAIGIAAVGAFLQLNGYIPGVGPEIAQPESAMRALVWSVSIVPSVCALLAALAILRVRPELGRARA